MSTGAFVVSTLNMRLAQCDSLLEWLIHRHPERDSFGRALEAVRTAQIIVAGAVTDAN